MNAFIVYMHDMEQGAICMCVKGQLYMQMQRYIITYVVIVAWC